ncbi:MAG: hypothetical protein KZQ95_22190 [Candidatus Thiodiazotropha sp. (ex Epidulcina cf. delphinae)]|nr:hypothetical protein [Candidatus Thiodiazotropha sp. (ex Epidulcina cf. delphinae)]
MTQDSLTVLQANGRGETWKSLNGVWQGDPDTQLTLEANGAGFKLTNPDASIEYYDPSGRLLRDTDSQGLVTHYAYDANGRLTDVTGPFGRKLNVSYNVNGQIGTISTPDGDLQYGYDTRTNLTSVTYPDGGSKIYHYEDPNFPHRLTGISDENNIRYATWAYDASGKVISSAHAGGVDKVELVYHTDGSTTVTDALNAQRTYTFETLHGVRKVTTVSGDRCVTCGSGHMQSRAYDANGFLSGYTDWAGNETSLVNDSRGRVQTRIEAVGQQQARTITTDWHPDFNLPIRTTEPGRQTDFTYNDTGQLLSRSVTDTATGRIRTVTYTYHPQGSNGAGLVATVDGPLSSADDVTRFSYDSQGNLNTITNALGHVTRITRHDPSGRPLTLVDPNGLTTTLSYDARGRLSQQTLSDGTTSRTTLYAYDAVGNLIQVTQPDGGFLSYAYDEAHRLIAIQDNQGNRIDYTLDAMGNRLSEQVSDPQGALTRRQSLVHDQLGQLHQLTDSQNHATGYGYDANGNLTQTTDANQNTTAQAYDPHDRLRQVTDPLNGATHYTYDAQHNLTQVTDPNGLTTTYEYDGLGNLVSQTSPDTGTTTYTVDEAGNRLTQTDARGVTVSYSYDALNRLIAIHYLDRKLKFGYRYDQGMNGIGRLTRLSDPHRGADYAYNAYGELISQTRASRNGFVTTFGYAYDNHGRLATLSYPSGKQLHYGYATDAQLTTLTLEQTNGATQPLASNLQRLPFGPIQALDYGNGLRLTRTFDQDYRLIAQSLPGVLDSSYAYDPVGNLSEWLEPARDQTFDYDAIDRLISASGAYGDLGFTYDATGNRLTQTEGTDTETYRYAPDSHRLLQILGAASDTRSYDAVGNTLQNRQGSYTYNEANRMVSFSQGTTQASYAYNGKGERIQKRVNGVTTYFRYSPEGQLLGEYDNDGNPLREYVYLDGQPIALLHTQHGTQALDLSQTPILSYGGAGQDVSATATVDTEGAALTLTGNGWKKIAYPYTVTPNTVLAFDFQSRAEGEIHGIGFDTDNGISGNRSFILHGTQTWGIQDYATYAGQGTQHFHIPVGQYFTGAMQWLTFINDHDVSNPSAESRFSNLRVYEADESAGATRERVAYLHTDHLGAVVKATDENQAIIWDAQRRPFGERNVTTAWLEMPLGFPGQYLDQETGNYYNYFRDYDPTTGRYLQSDPIGLGGGLNTYAYVGGNPLRYFDPLGLYTEVIIWRPVGWGSSSFGHVSSNVNGSNYSWGPGGWDTRYPNASDYADRQQTFRPGVGTILDLTPEQERRLEECYARSRGEYSSTSNNCADPHQDCLSEVLGSPISDTFFPVNFGNDLLDSPYYDGSTFYPGPDRSFGDDAPWAR